MLPQIIDDNLAEIVDFVMLLGWAVLLVHWAIVAFWYIRRVLLEDFEPDDSEQHPDEFYEADQEGNEVYHDYTEFEHSEPLERS